jgi:hypothetical protein
MDQVSLHLSKMAITKPIAPILESPNIHEIFVDDMDIYSADRETRHYILEVPNLYCGECFDDEDFIYARLRFSDSLQNIPDLDYQKYIADHNLIFSCKELNLDSCSIMAKILYIYQHITPYYTSLRHLRSVERLAYIPTDIIIWIANITDTLRILLDKKLFHYTKNDDMSINMFREMIYGLELITCHIRLICNHYKHMGYANLANMAENHMKKLIRLTNNMCIIMIYFWMYL